MRRDISTSLISIRTSSHIILDDGYNLVEDAGGTLTVFEDIKSNIQSSPEIRNGEEWGIAEYDWEDTTQDGNPVEKKVISYTYYEDFDWIVAPNVYYYELQQTAVEDARSDIRSNFETYLERRSIEVNGEQRPAYSNVRLVDAEGNGIVRSYRTEDGEIQSESIQDHNYADESWFTEGTNLGHGELLFGDVRTENGKQVMDLHTAVFYDDELAGVLTLTFNYDILTEITSEITVGDSGYVSIVNEDGRVVSHPDEAVISEGANIADESYAGGLASIAESKILAGETGQDTYLRTEDGEEHEYYVAYAPVTGGQSQFSVMTTVPKEDVTAPIAALGQSMAAETTSALDLLPRLKPWAFASLPL